MEASSVEIFDMAADCFNLSITYYLVIMICSATFNNGNIHNKLDQSKIVYQCIILKLGPSQNTSFHVQRRIFAFEKATGS